MKYWFYIVLWCTIACIPVLICTKQLQPQHAQELIAKAYGTLNGYVIPQDELHAIRTAGSDPTYGEITFEALQTLLNDINLTHTDVFYDLGCGLAQTCMQVALVTPARAVGIELSKTRLERAKQALSSLNKQHNIDLRERVSLKKGDITRSDIHDATVVFLCSTCFSDQLMNQVTQILSTLEHLRAVITLRKLPNNTFMTLHKTYQLPMTWHTNTTVYVYYKK